MVFELSTRLRGVFCSLSLNNKIWKEFCKKGPKNTIKYITMIMISLIVSLILLSFDDISGGSKYSNSFYFFYLFSYSYSYFINWASSSFIATFNGLSESCDYLTSFNYLDLSFFSLEGESSLIYCEWDFIDFS
jgi:hypothetical protein